MTHSCDVVHVNVCLRGQTLNLTVYLDIQWYCIMKSLLELSFWYKIKNVQWEKQTKWQSFTYTRKNGDCSPYIISSFIFHINSMVLHNVRFFQTHFKFQQISVRTHFWEKTTWHCFIFSETSCKVHPACNYLISIKCLSSLKSWN